MNDETLIKTFIAVSQDIDEAQSRLTELRKSRNALKHMIIGRGLELPEEQENEEETVQIAAG